MTVEEMQKAIDQLKADNNSEEAILGAFYRMFQDDKLTLDELDGVVNLMGYHLTDEFKAMSPEDQKTKGVEQTEEPAEGVTKEEIEEAKEVDDDGDDKEPKKETDDEDEDDSDDSDDSDEETKAMKLFGQK